MFKKNETENRTAEKRVPKERSLKPDRKTLSVLKTVLIPAVLAAVICVIIYLVMKNSAADAALKTSVVVMKEGAAANTYVAADEKDDYFEVVQADLAAVPDKVYTSLKDLPDTGFYIENAMDKSQMVMKDDIASRDAVMDKYKDGYETTSFAVESFSRGVNGSLRKGDIVDIYALDPETDMLTLLASDVYIADAYDSSGNRIAEENETAVSFTVYVTPEEVEGINKAIMYGKIQMYRK